MPGKKVPGAMLALVPHLLGFRGGWQRVLCRKHAGTDPATLVDAMNGGKISPAGSVRNGKRVKMPHGLGIPDQSFIPDSSTLIDITTNPSHCVRSEEHTSELQSPCN